LLQRVTPGGLLAAVLPSAWLDEPRFGPARAEWLRLAALRLAVRLPQPAVIEGVAPTAAVVLERDGASRDGAPAFAPEQPRMGRFHLRRYLQEVLAALAGSGRTL
jgi:hypothetical protein